MSTDVSTDAAVARAAEAAAQARPEFGAFFLARFLDLTSPTTSPPHDEARTCTVVLPYAAHLCNPQGSMHGGVIAIAMDVSMGHLCHHFLSTAMTIEMNPRFFRPLTGRGRCTATVLNAGRRLVHLESRLTDDEGRLVAFAAGSWHRLDAKDPKSRT
jgi:uncharacterized protein (TIGR00369 family)